MYKRVDILYKRAIFFEQSRFFIHLSQNHILV